MNTQQAKALMEGDCLHSDEQGINECYVLSVSKDGISILVQCPPVGAHKMVLSEDLVVGKRKGY